MSLGEAVKYDRIDFIFAARATVQTDTRAVVSVVTMVITNVFEYFLQRGESTSGCAD